MGAHEQYHYKTFEELLNNIEELKLDIPYEADIDILKKPVKYGSFICPNALAIHPMEGCDGDADGSPSDLTFRRYERFARGGAGLLWIEATAVVREGRANPRQLWIHNNNVHSFKKLADMTRKYASESMGSKHIPLMILQLTHSGRYSKPTGKPEPIIAQHSGVLDKTNNLPADYPLITDEELDKLKEKFIEAARLAKKVGFDGVDIKSCHGYLLIELLGSFTRRNSRYGGSFENRTRFLLEVTEQIRAEIPDLIVTSRLNVFDGYAYPYGFGVDKDDSSKHDLTEPNLLIEKLMKLGVPGINVAIGNPYYNPHHERPYDTPIEEGYIPEEHPLENIEKSIKIAKEAKENHSDLTTVGSGFS